jgi:hypothetical protein
VTTHWLIELDTNECNPLYLRGSTDRELGWTHDDRRATPFTTRASAEIFAYCRLNDGVRFTEIGARVI